VCCSVLQYFIAILLQCVAVCYPGDASPGTSTVYTWTVHTCTVHVSGRFNVWHESIIWVMDSFILPLHLFTTTHPYMCRDSFLRVPWRIHCNDSLIVWCTALEPVEMRRIYLEDLEILASNHIDFTLTHSLTNWPAARKVFIHATRRIHTCDSAP